MLLPLNYHRGLTWFHTLYDSVDYQKRDLKKLQVQLNAQVESWNTCDLYLFFPIVTCGPNWSSTGILERIFARPMSRLSETEKLLHFQMEGVFSSFFF